MAERDDEQASSNESVSGSVLRELFTNPIDQGYRPGAAMHADTGWKRFGMLLAVIALTTMAVWAALDLRDALTATDSPTRQLREEVETRLEYQALLQGNVDELRSGVDAEHELALPQDPAAAERSLQLRIASSAIPVEGPGITITLDDSHATTTNERVRDYDLQVVTNALWESGAEAIAINGQRLSSSSAIRSAGSAILVNLTPLAPPYVVAAIGDALSLQVEFARTGAASQIATLRDTFGLSVSVDTAENLELPAASETALRFAEPVP